MLEIFEYSFMVRAFAAGAVIGILAPLIGSFLVARRYSLIADSLSHVSLAGVAIGLLTGIYPVYTAIAASVVAAIIIERLRASKRVSGDSALAIFLSAGLAVAITLLGLAGGFTVDLFSYLFGSITTVREVDVLHIGILGIVVGGAIALLYKELVFVSFDEEVAQVSGIPAKALNTVLVVLTAVTVALSMRIVGALLVGALMVIPVVAAMQIAKSFKATIWYAIAIGLASVISGLFAAYYLDIPAGGAVVLASLALLGISMVKK
ncbi:MAG: metal ABC transporter permease [Candidatus Andersenbacteria bacterium RIFCSPHIGHO2_12_FULL_45_11]|uniref:Metal ABC transporter permease n=1 Tax=Candidatus Andersenbacteria bacterium RIFCSPHIGHO2_12_FULL_45_11 TaxID=1797281 RepID=A0A1G1X0W0_9BACT|nr:MAG: metal ABC transporter permease [Candidatus Andersenbacteria bacterium RIFCSPHIGHO2_12_FULL_45_11]